MKRIVDIDTAASAILAGHCVAIPTETVYGLAARADDDNAIKKIFAIKGRPLNHPLILHIAETWDLNDYAEDIPDYVSILIKHFWPGPLTLVLKARLDKVSSTITGGHDTVAIRSPNHPLTQALLKAVAMPLVAPSANPYEKISPTTAEHVLDGFTTYKEGYVLDGGRCALGIESTIIDATAPDNYAILREGCISGDDISRILPNIIKISNSGTASPGRALRHYQPKKKLLYFETQAALQNYVLNSAESACILSFYPWTMIDIRPFFVFESDVTQAFHEFYYQLRLADKEDTDVILIDLPPDETKWQALRERILKAGSCQSRDC